jgi:hypothetical protein
LWGIVLLEYLDEFATLAWHLAADGKLVEETFSRTLAKLDTIPFEASIPALTYGQTRDVLIAQAIAVLSDTRIGTRTGSPGLPLASYRATSRPPTRHQAAQQSAT